METDTLLLSVCLEVCDVLTSSLLCHLCPGLQPCGLAVLASAASAASELSVPGLARTPHMGLRRLRSMASFASAMRDGQGRSSVGIAWEQGLGWSRRTPSPHKDAHIVAGTSCFVASSHSP